MKKAAPTDNETRIRAAARQLFLQHGLAGARMQEIADLAGVDKALVHYYYRSKERLFALVFDESVAAFADHLRAALTTDLPLAEKLTRLVQYDAAVATDFPLVVRFILNELNRQPADVAAAPAWARLHELPRLFAQQVEAAVAAGQLRPVDPNRLFLMLVSLSLFPVVAQPLFQSILNLPADEYGALLADHAQALPALLLRALAP